MEKNKFHFIVGIGRSGTTLLMSMLNAHPAIQATPEINFFNFFNAEWGSKTQFKEKDLERVMQYVLRYKNNFSGFGFDFDYLKKQNVKSFSELYKQFYSSFTYGGEKKDSHFFFDKNPINSLYLDKIISLFPDSKFVFIIRDPRAGYLSRKQKKNFRSTNIYFNAYRWLLYNKEVLKYASLYPDKFFILKYEDLVSNVEGEMRRMAAFFEFDYKEAMLNFHENVAKNSFDKVASAEKNKERAHTKYSDLSKPVNTDRMDAWQKDLSPQEIYIIDAITSELASEFGYEKYASATGTTSPFKALKGGIKAHMGIVKDKLQSRLPLKFKLTRRRKKG
jgi:hypothetical protein